MTHPAYHAPVMVDEAVSYLIGDPDGIYIDGTLGGGGHSESILKKLGPHGKLIGLDRDSEAIAACRKRLSEYKNRIQIIQAPFAELDRVVRETGVDLMDGLLLDLGLSSHQIDVPERGFSYLQDGPLDMRMGTDQTLTAREVIQTYPEESLADLFFYYGEERRARQIARKIVSSRRNMTVSSTGQLAALIQAASPGPMVQKTLARIFQALRIEVNDEMNQLKTVLQKGGGLLRAGGRMVIISYHSLEDRLVKRFFKAEELSIRRVDIAEKTGVSQFRILTKKVLRPPEEEIRSNPRARSARLRAAEKITAGLESR
ncbi:16S rRNA (cytosine(1402)-N(4))-methyltransferase RsmH [bacterium]|nr:16S rRNA (cytosine(1402)-N(4))-methyltransferase RsmH [bacterium]